MRDVWARLSRAVMERGTYESADALAFELAVRSVARAFDLPADAAPSAAARIDSAARTALASLGLDPASRNKVSKAEEPPDPDDPRNEFM